MTEAKQQEQLPALIKYPRTTHLFDAGGTATTQDDLILPNLSTFLDSLFCQTVYNDNNNNKNNKRKKGIRNKIRSRTIVIEEKIDGANLGISLCPITCEIMVQNRSHYIYSSGRGGGGNHAQFSYIHEWISKNQQALYELLQGGDKILYGEWVVARHSIPYHRLPDRFIAFDIYNRNKRKFLSRNQFHDLLKHTRIPVVPVIEKATFDRQKASAAKENFQKHILSLLETKSVFRDDDGTVEGIVLRIDGNDDSEIGPMWLEDKYKVVRPDFIQGCDTGQHWASRKIQKQIVDYVFRESYLDTCYCCATGATTSSTSDRNDKKI